MIFKAAYYVVHMGLKAARWSEAHERLRAAEGVYKLLFERLFTRLLRSFGLSEEAAKHRARRMDEEHWQEYQDVARRTLGDREWALTVQCLVVIFRILQKLDKKLHSTDPPVSLSICVRYNSSTLLTTRWPCSIEARRNASRMISYSYLRQPPRRACQFGGPASMDR
jgi:hypothetical protein